MIEIQEEFEIEMMKDYDAICCTTNMIVHSNMLVMGAGIARIFSDYWPHLRKEWGERLKNGQHYKGFMVTKNKESFTYPRNFVAFPTKRDYAVPSLPDLIETSARTLFNVASIMDWKKVLLPKPGCLNGGLKWEFVKTLMLFLDDRFYIIDRAK